MIIEEHGDLLECDANILAHQTNCKGVMGAGIAKQIRDRLLTEQQFRSYQDLCRKYGSSLLGSCQYLPIEGEQGQERYVANIFSQDGYGRHKQQTNYRAMYEALRRLHSFAEDRGLSAAIPGLMGCGLAGGDWDFVKNSIIRPIFESSSVPLEIIYRAY